MSKLKNVLSGLLLILLLGVSASGLQAQDQHVANQTGDVYGAASLGYGFELEEPSIGVNGYYSITEEIRAGGDLIFFLMDTDNLNVWELNINGHYIFRDRDNLRLYGLAGINRIRFSWDVPDDSPFAPSSFSETGLNIGGGVEYDLGGFLLFGEPKFTISDADQFSINVGARLSF